MPIVSVGNLLQLKDLTLYGGVDPRDAPRYTFTDGARATGIPASTIRAWVVGQSYRRKNDRGFFHPVIGRPQQDDARLSFTNLIEAHVLRALRTVHEVKLDYIRRAVAIAEKECGISRLLISPALRASAGKLFLDRYTDFLELSPARQLAMRVVLDQYLDRVDFDESKLPAFLYPFSRTPHGSGVRIIALSPFVAFGRPVLARTGISTKAVVERIDAGEPASDVVGDYRLEETELEEAILYEAAA